MYMLAMFAAATFQTIFLHQYFHRSMVTGMRLRSATVTAVYQKSLKLTSAARQGTTVGEIVNLMTIDAQVLIPHFQLNVQITSVAYSAIPIFD
jgi:hypothetical protein